MALNAAQVVTLAEILGETPDEAQAALDALPRRGYDAGEVTAIENAVIADIAVYAALKDKHLRVSGGRDGVDLDFDRDRGALRTRNRIRLGMSSMSDADSACDPNALRMTVWRGGCWT